MEKIMSAPFLASITLLGGGTGAQPKDSNVLAIITPLSGGHIDAGLPGGGPVDPGWGGGWGSGNYPSQGLPWGPGHPDGGIPISPGHPSGGFPIDPVRPDNSLPPGGTPVPPEISNGLPPPAGNLGTQVVVAIYVPGKGWTAKSFPMPTKPGQPVNPAPKPAG
jgi:hypothetical protein